MLWMWILIKKFFYFDFCLNEFVILLSIGIRLITWFTVLSIYLLISFSKDSVSIFSIADARSSLILITISCVLLNFSAASFNLIKIMWEPLISNFCLYSSCKFTKNGMLLITLSTPVISNLLFLSDK